MSTPDLPADVDAYYLPLGGGSYQPTIHAQGTWHDDEQHMAPISGLITHALTQHDPRPDMQLGRITFEILGLIPAQVSHIEVTTIRPGRTIELLEATLTIAGRVVIRARAWRLSIQDTSHVTGIELPAMTLPQECEPYSPKDEWPGGFLGSVEGRAVPGGREGRRQVWLRSPYRLVQDEKAHPLASYVMLVDAANGVATRVRPTQMMFPNVELSLHLLRQPDPTWVGLDTCVSFGSDGLGLTSTTLNDLDGPFGRAEQCLTVRDFPTA